MQGHSEYKDYISHVVDSVDDPITAGLTDYAVTDELYYPNVFDESRSTRFLTAFDVDKNETATHGLRHTHGEGRVLYFAQGTHGPTRRVLSSCLDQTIWLQNPGHDMAEFEQPAYNEGNHAFGTIVKRSIQWLAKVRNSINNAVNTIASARHQHIALSWP